MSEHCAHAGAQVVLDAIISDLESSQFGSCQYKTFHFHNEMFFHTWLNLYFSHYALTFLPS